MMYPRLKLARNLLTDDGVIFISIGNQELDNLKKLCSEIFGEQNFLSMMMWRKNKLVMKGDKAYGCVGNRLSIVLNHHGGINDNKGSSSVLPWRTSKLETIILQYFINIAIYSKLQT